MLTPRTLLARLSGTSSFAAMFRVVIMRSLAMGTTVLTGLITAAVLGPAGRGEQAAMILAPQFLAGLSSLGLHASLIYNMKTDPDHAWEYLGANLIMNTISAVVMTAVGWFILPFWLSDFDSGVVATARWILLLAPICAMAWVFTAASEVKGWFSYVNLVSNLQSLAILAILLLLIWGHWLTARSSAYAYSLMGIPVFLALGGRMLMAGRPVFTLRPAITGRLLRYGLRFYGTDLLGSLSGYIDQIVIMPLLTPSAIGVYVVARSLARTLGILSDAVGSVLFPSVAGLHKAEIVAVVFKTLRVTAAINLVLAVSLAAAAPFLLHLVYGDRFAGAAAPLRILLAASVFVNSARILYQIYNGSGRPEIVTAVEFLATAVGVALTIALVPILGTSGAALAILCGSVIRLACALGGIRRLIGISLPFSEAIGTQVIEEPPVA